MKLLKKHGIILMLALSMLSPLSVKAQDVDSLEMEQLLGSTSVTAKVEMPQEEERVNTGDPANSVWYILLASGSAYVILKEIRCRT